MKALLVDDEHFAIQGMLHVYDWADNGFEKVLVAYNGLEAIDILRREKIDLLITDIKMPKMDGFELSNYVVQNEIECETIILSGYEEFSYVKKMLQIGVIDYLLKPVERKELEAAIQKAKDTIIEKSKRKVVLSELKTKVDLMQLESKSLYYHDLIQNQQKYKEEGQLDQVIRDGALVDSAFRLAIFCLDTTIQFPDEVVIRNAFIKKLILDDMKHDLTGDLFYYKEHVFLCCSSETIDLKQLVENWNKECKRELGFSFSVGLSRQYDSLYYLADAVNECQKAIMPCFLNGVLEKILYYSDKEPEDKDTYYYSYIDEIIMNLKLRNLSNVTQILETLFGKMKQQNRLLAEHYYGICYSILSVIDSDETTMEQLMRFHTLEALRKYMTDRLEYYNRNQNDKERVESSTIRNIIRYVNENYSRNLTLANVSKQVYISPNYLCKLFKKEMGINFNNYLTNVRIQKGKDLLKNTEWTTQEIAESVGYTDYAYFLQVFKSKTGLTTTQYREGVRRNQNEHGG